MKISELSLDEQAHTVVAHLAAYSCGRAHATTNGQVSAHFEMPDIGSSGREAVPASRHMTKILNRAREIGYPVVCDTNGVYLAEFREEINGMLADYVNRARVFTIQAQLLTAAAQGLPSRVD